jgi:hypothetical protein
MSLLETLPDNYQFTPADLEAFWELFKKEMEGQTLTDEEEDFYWTLDNADRFRLEHNKRMPTVAELREYISACAKKREQQRIDFQISHTYVMRDEDFSNKRKCEPGGPREHFVSVAKELREQNGKNPTYGQVKQEIAKRKT